MTKGGAQVPRQKSIEFTFWGGVHPSSSHGYSMMGDDLYIDGDKKKNKVKKEEHDYKNTNSLKKNMYLKAALGAGGR